MSDLTRRSLLAGAGVGAAALAGCLGGGGGNDDDDPTDTAQTTTMVADDNTAAGPRLRHIDLINRDDVAHTVHVQVERDGEVVYWDVHDLEASGEGEAASTLIEQSWEDAAGTITIEARVDDGEVLTQTYAAAESDCLGVFAPINDGRLSFYDGAADCGDTTTDG